MRSGFGARGKSMTEPAEVPPGPDADEVAPAVLPLPPASDPQARNEALRTLFLTDPHFRQSDGLDVAVDEVFEIASSPRARQRKIELAREMGMLDDELVEQELPVRDAGDPGDADDEGAGTP